MTNLIIIIRMFTDHNALEIYCNEPTTAIVPASSDVSASRQPIEQSKEQSMEEELKQQFSLYLSLVAKVDREFKLTNQSYQDALTLDLLEIAKLLPEYGEIAVPLGRPQLSCRTRSRPAVTLVLDLDETLISSSIEQSSSCDRVVNLKEGNTVYKVCVSFRPYVKEFLEFAANYFEVVVFTASEKKYADGIIDLLDPYRKLIRRRLYRDSCLNVNSVLIKNLDILGRDLKKVIIVDNAPISFLYQLENGVLIKSYMGDKRDNALPTLLNALMKVKDADDVREGLRSLLA
eukprot:TRINITY_DN716_c0_g2_i8.p1 TRINITY_DN716_c0_g2~~TRINITY_DN716_c0_g2_i8.p1  ORF type:complete len:289 (-),score=71.79 TRINITY_DN716_c0_g2_i8:240-1106(-)